MRVLSIVDEVFGHREGPMLERLAIGLADEGVRVVRAWPESTASPAGGGLFVEATTYALRGLVFTRRARAERLIERVRAGDLPIDLVHALGGSAWRFAAQVAFQAGAPLALEAWRFGLVKQVQAIRAVVGQGPVVRVLCPDDHAVEEYRRAGLADIAQATPWGVHVADEASPILEPERATSITIVASGRDPRGIEAALEGLSRALPPSNDARIFLDADAVRRGRLFPMIERLGLSERTSLIPDMEARRDLILTSDLMLLPEALGERRTIVLDAMGRAMAVIARRDPEVPTLIDSKTARLVAPSASSAAVPGPADWAGAIASILGNPAEARRLGASARQHVAAHCRASAHVASVLSAYNAMIASPQPSLAFPR